MKFGDDKSRMPVRKLCAFVSRSIFCTIVLLTAPSPAFPTALDSPDDDPCGPPLTPPQPTIGILAPADGASGVARAATLIVSSSDAYGIAQIRGIELVPEHGSVVELPVPSSKTQTPAADGRGYVVRVSFPVMSGSGFTLPLLKARTNYRILLKVEDIDSPPKCPIIWDDGYGGFTTGD